MKFIHLTKTKKQLTLKLTKTRKRGDIDITLQVFKYILLN
jgi:hypothetical protein